jgi:hypothetical protein
LFLCGIFLIYIFQDIFTNWKLFLFSNKWTVDIQAHGNKGILVIMEIASNGSLVILGVSLLWMLLSYKNRARFMGFGVYFSFCVFLMSLLK